MRLLLPASLGALLAVVLLEPAASRPAVALGGLKLGKAFGGVNDEKEPIKLTTPKPDVKRAKSTFSAWKITRQEEEVEEKLSYEEEVAHAVQSRSLNKYLLGNQWRSFHLGASLALWLSLIPAMLLKKKSKAFVWWYHQVFVLAFTKYGGDVARRVSKLLSKASDGDMTLNTLSEASGRIVSDPGAVASLIYVTVFLLVSAPVRFAVAPLFLEEATELVRVGIDLLTIFGILTSTTMRDRLSKETLATSKPLVAVNLLIEVLVGGSLLTEVLLKGGRLGRRSLLGIGLYANFLYRRISEIPELKENLTNKDWLGVQAAVLRSLVGGMGALAQSTAAVTADLVDSMEGNVVGDKVRAVLIIAGFLEPKNNGAEKP